jgi:hypothetical protein
MWHSAVKRAGSMTLCITLGTAQVWAQTAPGSSSPAPLPPGSPLAPAASTTPAAPPLASVLTGEAKAEYQSAVLVYADGDFKAALLKFQRAYDLSKEGRLLWNMAVCEKNLRHYSRALGLVERYQREARASMSEQDRREASDLVNAIGSFVGQVWVTVDLPGAAVTIDDEPVGTTPLTAPLQVDIGSRRLRVSKSGYLDYTEMLEVAGKAEVRATAKLEKETHEGRISVDTEPGAAITIDGQAMGVGRWSGTVASGGHTLRVNAKGKRAYQSEVVVRDKESRDISVTLDPESSGLSTTTWLLLTGGAVLVAGAAIGSYFLFKPKDEPAPPAVVGTMPPGSVPLAIWR